MEYQFHSQTTLVSRAAVSVAASVWIHQDLNRIYATIVKEESSIFSLMQDPGTPGYSPIVWGCEIEQIFENVNELLLPDLMKEVVLDAVDAFGNQIEEWMRKLKHIRPKRSKRLVDLNKIIRWSTLGILNTEESAEELLRSKTLNRKSALAISCRDKHVMCSLHDIKTFLGTDWERLIPVYHDCIVDTESGWHLIISSTLRWQMIGQTALCVKLIECSFQVFIALACEVNGNLISLSATELAESIDTMFCRFSPLVLHPEALKFLLSQLAENEVERLMRSHPSNMLLQFLSSPFHSCYVGMAEKVWSDLGDSAFDNIVSCILSAIKTSNRCHIYLKIFIEFWSKCPLELRTHYMENEFRQFLQTLFRPKSPKAAFKMLFQGEDTQLKLHGILIANGNAMLVLFQENRFKAFECLIENFLPMEPLVEGFQQVYRHICRRYLFDYYGE